MQASCDCADAGRLEASAITTSTATMARRMMSLKAIPLLPTFRSSAVVLTTTAFPASVRPHSVFRCPTRPPLRRRRPARAALLGRRSFTLVQLLPRQFIWRIDRSLVVRLVSQVRLQRVIADAKAAAGSPLIPAAPIEDDVRVAAAPGTHRFAAMERGAEDGHVIATNCGRQIIQLDDVGLSKR